MQMKNILKIAKKNPNDTLMTEVWPGNNAMYGRINNGNGNGNGRISNLKTLFDTRPDNRGNQLEETWK